MTNTKRYENKPLLELLKLMGNISYWDDPQSIILESQSVKTRKTIKEWIEILEEHGFIPGNQYESYYMNRVGIWGTNGAWLSNNPIFKIIQREVSE